MPEPRRANRGKPWTAAELDTLRNLALAGGLTSDIAKQLGRSREAVSKQAQKLGISIGEKALDLNVEPSPPPPSALP